jgi:hypothetical protein
VDIASRQWEGRAVRACEREVYMVLRCSVAGAARWFAAAALMMAACGGKGSNGGAPGDASPGSGGDSGSGGGGVDAAAGSTPITIRVFADGVPTFTGVTENVPLLAFQDGDGAWTALTGAGGVYHATATGARYGVAVGCAPPDGGLTVYYQAVGDATDLPVEGCFQPPADPASITVSVLNADGRQSFVSVGAIGKALADSGSVTLSVPKQKADVFVATQVGPDGAATDPRALRGVTLDVTANASLAVDLTQAIALESHPLTIVDAQPAGSVETFAQVTSIFYTQYSYGGHILLRDTLTPNLPVTTTTQYRTPAAAMRQAGEIMYARALTNGTTAAGLSYMRVVNIQTASAISLTMTLPEVVTATPPTVDDAAIPRATAQLPIRPATLGHALYQASFTTSNAQTSRTVAIIVRPGWAQGQSAVTVATPDLSQLSGWTADMALLPGVDVDWSVLIDDRNVTIETPVSDGKRIIESSLSGTIQRFRAAGVSPIDPPRAAEGARRFERFAR